MRDSCALVCEFDARKEEWGERASGFRELIDGKIMHICSVPKLSQSAFASSSFLLLFSSPLRVVLRNSMVMPCSGAVQKVKFVFPNKQQRQLYALVLVKCLFFFIIEAAYKPPSLLPAQTAIHIGLVFPLFFSFSITFIFFFLFSLRPLVKSTLLGFSTSTFFIFSRLQNALFVTTTIIAA